MVCLCAALLTSSCVSTDTALHDVYMRSAPAVTWFGYAATANDPRHRTAHRFLGSHSRGSWNLPEDRRCGQGRGGDDAVARPYVKPPIPTTNMVGEAARRAITGAKVRFAALRRAEDDVLSDPPMAAPAGHIPPVDALPRGPLDVGGFVHSVPCTSAGTRDTSRVVPQTVQSGTLHRGVEPEGG